MKNAILLGLLLLVTLTSLTGDKPAGGYSSKNHVSVTLGARKSN